MRNKKFKALSTFGQAHKIAKEETEKRYQEIFSECAADVMQQTLANVLLCLERECGFGEIRLKRFVKALQSWCDVMNSPTEITGTWTTNDNIEYFKERYGIDLRKEFQAEIK